MVALHIGSFVQKPVVVHGCLDKEMWAVPDRHFIADYRLSTYFFDLRSFSIFLSAATSFLSAVSSLS